MAMVQKLDDIRILSLFCGCGGLCEGFRRAGFKILAANDIWESALVTYRYNHPNVRVFSGDIRDKAVSGLICAFFEEKGGCDLIIGGPPCQAYSMSGKRDENDPRGKLFENYVEMVKHLRPRLFVMENVLGILTMKHGDCLVPDMIREMFNALGYDMTEKILNAADYGVPQRRERVIFVGTRDGVSFMYPAVAFGGPPLRPYVTAKEALDELKDIRDNKDWVHVRMRHSPDFLAKIQKTRPGFSVTGYSESFFRLLPDEPSLTAKANNGSVFIHYEQDRTLTSREMATLQSFNYNYRFEGSKHDVLVQICNAVPPLMAQAIAESVRKAVVR